MAIMTVMASGEAHASENKTILDLPTTNTISAFLEAPVEEPKEEPKEVPKDVVYIVQPGDTLESVSKAHTTTWKRLWDKNSTLTHPDQIKPGERLTIPRNEEVLADRPVPTPVITASAIREPARQTTNRVISRGAVAGNTYTPGYCTWYVKNQRPDIPNGLGNANTWYSRARSMGLSTGTSPRVGAVAVTKAYMHVALVIGVNGNSVTVREMNYKGLYVVSTRTTSASEFNYIY